MMFFLSMRSFMSGMSRMTMLGVSTVMFIVGAVMVVSGGSDCQLEVVPCHVCENAVLDVPSKKPFL